MQLKAVQALEGHTDRVWAVEWSPTGDLLASCSGDKTVRIWARRAGREAEWFCVAVLEEAQTRTIRCCAWSPDGTCLATGSFDATTAIWELQAGTEYALGTLPAGCTWEQIAVLEGHENEVKGVAWNPSGALIATCSRDKSVWLWESLGGVEYECVDVKQGHTQDVKSVAWHPGGEVLVSTSYDDSIKLWVESGDEWVCAQTLGGPGGGHTSTVWAASFEGEGARMVSASDDRSLKFWACRSERGEPRWRLISTLPEAHERSIYSVHWSAAGLVATGSGDNSIGLFAEEPGTSKASPPSEGELDPPCSFSRVLHREQAHSSDVNCVRWHPTDPHLLASAGDDGLVKLWRVSPHENGVG